MTVALAAPRVGCWWPFHGDRRCAARGRRSRHGHGVGYDPALSKRQISFATAATEAAARRAVSAINQALASGDMTVLDTVFATDYVNHTPRRSLLTGQPFSADVAGLKTALTELRTIAPDAVILIEDVVASGDTAAVRATFRGTLDTSMVSLPEGADPRLRIGGAAFARFVGGQVVESWVYDEAADSTTSRSPRHRRRPLCRMATGARHAM